MTALAAHPGQADGKRRDAFVPAVFPVVQARPVEVTVSNYDGGRLLSYRLRPIQVATGFRLLARHLAAGRRTSRPTFARKPFANRAPSAPLPSKG